jgi:carbamate kinase
MRLADKRIVVALGGNAILRSKQLDSYADQFDNIRRTCRQIVQLIAEGYQPILTHGNGPQVGNLLIQNEAAGSLVPAVPLDVCGAETLDDALAGLHGTEGTLVVPDETRQLSFPA